jgi:hypothetical protein
MPVAFQNRLAVSLHLLLLTFHTCFTFLSTHHSQLSSHATFSLMCSICLSTLQLYFKTAPLICFVCRVTFALFIHVSNYKHQNKTYFETSTRSSRGMSARHFNAQTPKHFGTEVMCNSLYKILSNFANS